MRDFKAERTVRAHRHSHPVGRAAINPNGQESSGSLTGRCRTQIVNPHGKWNLIADDPDAPGRTWVHWVLFDLPADSRSLPENVPAEANLADGGRHGKNSWGSLGYGGPCPPSGTHRYFFRLYALDTVLNLEAGTDKEALLEAMQGHIVGQAELMGRYSR